MCVGECIRSLDSVLSLRTAHSACVGGLAVIYWLQGDGEKRAGGVGGRVVLNATHINSSPCQKLSVTSAAPGIVGKRRWSSERAAWRGRRRMTERRKKKRPQVDDGSRMNSRLPASKPRAECRQRTADMFPAGLSLFSSLSMTIFCRSAHKHKETKG